MNAAALYFASGDSLYSGVVLLFVMIVTPQWRGRRWLQVLRSLVTWIAVALLVMASPPFPVWADAIFATSFLLWLTADRSHPGSVWSRLRFPSAAVLLLWLLVFPLLEFTHRRMPAISGAPADHLVVLGDSISSGIDPRVPAWPAIFQQQTGLSVKNLSRAGADVAEAQLMARSVGLQDTLILIEIGGNDLLAGEPSAEFGRRLDALLAGLAVPGRTIVMFELPLLPHKIEYGILQRRIAAQYRVFLIPKHYFTAMLGGAGATSDGLHLSQNGTRAMAALVAQVLSPMLKSGAKTDAHNI
jgi:acyl-CoA thioesterase I